MTDFEAFYRAELIKFLGDILMHPDGPASDAEREVVDQYDGLVGVHLIGTVETPQLADEIILHLKGFDQRVFTQADFEAAVSKVEAVHRGTDVTCRCGYTSHSSTSRTGHVTEAIRNELLKAGE